MQVLKVPVKINSVIKLFASQATNWGGGHKIPKEGD